MACKISSIPQSGDKIQIIENTNTWGLRSVVCNSAVNLNDPTSNMRRLYGFFSSPNYRYYLIQNNGEMTDISLPSEEQYTPYDTNASFAARGGLLDGDYVYYVDSTSIVNPTSKGVMNAKLPIVIKRTNIYTRTEETVINYTMPMNKIVSSEDRTTSAYYWAYLISQCRILAKIDNRLVVDVFLYPYIGSSASSTSSANYNYSHQGVFVIPINTPSNLVYYESAYHCNTNTTALNNAQLRNIMSCYVLNNKLYITNALFIYSTSGSKGFTSCIDIPINGDTITTSNASYSSAADFNAGTDGLSDRFKKGDICKDICFRGLILYNNNIYVPSFTFEVPSVEANSSATLSATTINYAIDQSSFGGLFYKLTNGVMSDTDNISIEGCSELAYGDIYIKNFTPFGRGRTSIKGRVTKAFID